VKCLRGHAEGVVAVAFAADARFVVSGSRDGGVTLWPLEAARPPVPLRARFAGSEHRYDFWIPESGDLVWWMCGSVVSCWSCDTQSVVFEREVGEAWDLAFARDGSAFAVAATTGTVSVYCALDARNGTLTPVPFREPRAVCFTPDSGEIAIGGEDGSVEIWSIGEQVRTAEFGGVRCRIDEIAICSRGERIGARAGGVAHVWDVRSGSTLLHAASDADLRAVVEGAEGSRILSRSDGGSTVFLSRDGGDVIGWLNMSLRQTQHVAKGKIWAGECLEQLMIVGLEEYS
jgi:WD40 repeat protein